MQSSYTPTIGLEIHAELKTKSKMFCGSINNASETRANVNVCPVCMAHPGTLPVINREAVAAVLRVGVAVGSSIADYTEFDRKNYFYPDLPKGYQLSQYEYPLVSGGMLNGIQITRIHLEEDTASSTHDESSGMTLIDYNRAGVPLMELVTEPVLHSPAEAAKFGEELQLLLRTLGVSDADMEKGQMRLEANVSVSNTDVLGTKVEIKNINSFRAMERAAAYEIKRQVALLESGGAVIQETRGWDDSKQSTFSQRIKEGSADYRYFPDPDLPSLRLSEYQDLSIKSIKDSLPELPWERRARFESLGAKPEDAESFVRDHRFGNYFSRLAEISEGKKDLLALSVNYIANDLVKIVRDIEDRDAQILTIIPIQEHLFLKLMNLLQIKKISSRSAKDLLLIMTKDERDPEALAQENGLLMQVLNQNDLITTLERIVGENPEVVKEYKAGKSAAIEYLVGQSMKALRGAADAPALREQLKDILAN